VWIEHLIETRRPTVVSALTYLLTPTRNRSEAQEHLLKNILHSFPAVVSNQSCSNSLSYKGRLLLSTWLGFTGVGTALLGVVISRPEEIGCSKASAICARRSVSDAPRGQEVATAQCRIYAKSGRYLWIKIIFGPRLHKSVCVHQG